MQKTQTAPPAISQMHPAQPGAAPPAPPSQPQTMPVVPAPPAPAPLPIQHTQYAPQQQNHVQGTTYQPQPQPQQQQTQQQQQQQTQPQQHQFVSAPVAPGTMQQQQTQQVQQQPAVAPAPPQQAASLYSHQGLNGGWQSDQDYNERRKMIAKM